MNTLFEKVAQFTKVAVNSMKSLESDIADRNEKIAEYDQKFEEYQTVLKKVAKVLYDTDFITDEDERRSFLKKANDNPAYLANILIKTCNAADVSFLGKASKVKVSSYDNDPIAARAFGWGSNTSLIDDDDE